MQRFPGQPVFSRHRPSPALFERILLFGGIILLILGVIGYMLDVKQRTVEQPASGGTYTEGVIADSPTKVERIVTQLTNIGLTYRDDDGTIKPALAESWSISEDQKVYSFHVRQGYSASGLLATIQNSKTNWSGIEITAPDEATLQFKINEPYSLFLSTTTNPLFPYGPYEVTKRDKQEVILRARGEFVLGKPFIQRVVIKSYDSQDQLQKAAKDGEFNGTADFVDAVPKTFAEYTVELPRYNVLFFNMTRSAFRKIEDRQRVINQTDGAPVNYTLLTSQAGPSSDLADTLVRELSASHIALTVTKKNGMALQKEEIAKREFDLLLYGINYGANRDYYPFWHSSQSTQSGLNITGIKDKDLDQLLEGARKELDPIKQESVNKQIEQYLTNKALQKIISQEKFHFWVDRSIKGIKYGTIDEGNGRFGLMWQWYIKSTRVKPVKS